MVGIEAFGKFIDELNADPGWQQLVASFQKNPPAEPVESSLIRELPQSRDPKQLATISKRY
jgi:hypothetical protein